MGSRSHSVRDFLIRVLMTSKWNCGFVVQFVVLSDLWLPVSGLGSMSSIAISYGEKGPAFCGIKSDGSHLVNCYGSNSAIIHETPAHFPFIGLTAGDGFVCGLLLESNRPYCWGSSGYLRSGVPRPMMEEAEYVEISAGDYHLCGLRKPLTGRRRNLSLIDCWGYNMTRNHVFDGQIQSISAGSVFNCGLFSENRTVFCWGDESSSRVISLIPQEMRFQKIAAGGYHVCGILVGVNSRAFCWGRSLDFEGEISAISAAYLNQGNVDLPPSDPMLSVVGGKFHACGIKSYDGEVICWGYTVKPSTPTPTGIKFYGIAAGNYFTCGILAEKSLLPVCWGLGFPTSLPLAVSPGLCKTTPCPPGSYEFVDASTPCKSPGSRACLSCSNGCPAEMYQKIGCTSKSDRQCDYNCSSCYSSECFSNCSSLYSDNAKEKNRFWSLQLPVIIAELGFAVFLVVVVTTAAVFYVRYRLRNCQCPAKQSKTRKNSGGGSSASKDNGKIRPEMDEIKLRRAQMFTYEELEKATSGFKEESIAIDMQYEEGNIVEWAVPLIRAGDISAILDPVLKPPSDPEALKRIANVACKCVRMRGKERPSMDIVTTALERALAQLMGSPCNDQPILPTEVVLGSSRLHKKSSQRSSSRSAVSETDAVEGEDQRIEFRAPSWITFPSLTSSQGRKSSVSDADVDGKTSTRNLGYVANVGDGLRSLEEEIGPASPQERLFLQHNF
ncbi:SERINE/THREONINE-PROTEIN KINASE-LIKE PROTEIN ACR4 [Salix purpurea]|uniref:non-specific serine/threonine protein kinase n=1 Tax=Salix purpurea TaxID=77065 RepID=A0A9Q0UQ49_SALPP|nr:SERINE/THREONINE-PROTEIN KINASE-LIKE PROTEIN ACR4 [Salix purpurea]